MESLITEHRVREHDFISGKPKLRWFDPEFITEMVSLRIRPITNPCNEIPLGVDYVDCVLGQGFERGELGVTMSPPSTGKSQIVTNILTAMRGGQPTNFDYQSLYPEVQRTYNIRPEGYENWTPQQKFAHKLMLNSNY